MYRTLLTRPRATCCTFLTSVYKPFTFLPKSRRANKKRMVRLDSLPSFFNVRLCGLCLEANDWATGPKATYSSILRISSTMLEPFSRASSMSNTLSLQPAMSATSLSSIFKGDWP